MTATSRLPSARMILAVPMVVAFLALTPAAPFTARSQMATHAGSLVITGAAPELTLVPAVRGVADAVYVTSVGDGSGRLFVVQRSGVISIAVDGQLLPSPFLDLTGLVASEGAEMGLLSLAVHPDYAHNGYLYVAFTGRDTTNTVMRFQASDDPVRVDPGSGTVLLALPDRAPGFHNGGTLAFGPDGYLYVSTGDEGLPPSIVDNAQDLQSLFGKILRLDVDNGTPYAIPPDNPFVGRDDARPEIWALGLRNPWRMSFDRLTGDLFIADVGDIDYEEINVQPAASVGGENYGWPVMEGHHCYPAGSACDPTPFVAPVAEYGHGEGCAVIGGYMYRGSRSPALAGRYLFADICSGRIWSLHRTADARWQKTLLLETGYHISSFGEDKDGEIYVTEFQTGTVYHVVASGDYPVPVITGLSPPGAAQGSDLSALHIYGDGFVDGAIVRWDGRDRETHFVNSTLLVALIDTSDLIDAREALITVRNPSPSAGESSPRDFPVIASSVQTAAFSRTWARIDEPIAAGVANRTWMWGAGPNTDLVIEPYAEAPFGMRLVQYFDKSRMEVTQPDADPDTPWFVTNGLLVLEMVTGMVQIGDGAYERHRPAQVNAAGDPDDQTAPTYTTFGPLLEVTLTDREDVIVRGLRRDGSVYHEPRFAAYGVGTAVLVPETRHWVAEPFWEFMRASGVVFTPEGPVDELLFSNPFYAAGYPITEAYWTNVKVGGGYLDVLIQCFERRCLTYTPDNPVGWQVESGNVGLHYRAWRYGD